jgi:hypothetical protein
MGSLGQVPQRGDDVGVQGHQGVFTVVHVFVDSHTVTLELKGGTNQIVNGVPWSTLTFGKKPK